MKTTANIAIAYNPTDAPGQDGDWTEATTPAAAMKKARSGMRQICRNPKQLAAIMDSYREADTASLHEMSDDDFDRLAGQWKTARSNGWTSAAADAALRAEIERRENA